MKSRAPLSSTRRKHRLHRLASTKTYGDIDPSFTGLLVGFLETDGVSAVYSRTSGETVIGSPYSISAVLSPTEILTNYNIAYNTADFTITAKEASVTPVASGKTYGDVDPALSGLLTGFLETDEVSAAYSRTQGETVLGSPYSTSAVLNPSDILTNYNITYHTASFTINTREGGGVPCFGGGGGARARRGGGAPLFGAPAPAGAYQFSITYNTAFSTPKGSIGYT
ncbi:MAG: hypothetical protein IPJ20_06440 [Flammeovirgaceae bacterium]|nr:hypothetical protein [Flammeovirgaceae bacterium]